MSRSLAILDLLGASPEPLGPGALAGRLSLHRSTIHRALALLEAHGFVRREPARGGYSLGIKLVVLGRQALAQLDSGERERPAV